MGVLARAGRGVGGGSGAIVRVLCAGHAVPPPVAPGSGLPAGLIARKREASEDAVKLSIQGGVQHNQACRFLAYVCVARQAVAVVISGCRGDQRPRLRFLRRMVAATDDRTPFLPPERPPVRPPRVDAIARDTSVSGLVRRFRVTVTVSCGAILKRTNYSYDRTHPRHATPIRPHTDI